MIAAYNYQWLDRGTWIGAIAYPFIFGSPNLRLAVYCGIVLTTLALVIMATTLISLFDQYQPGPIRAPLAVKYCVSLGKCFLYSLCFSYTYRINFIHILAESSLWYMLRISHARYINFFHCSCYKVLQMDWHSTSCEHPSPPLIADWSSISILIVG